MSIESTVQALLAGAARLADCRDKRVQWARETAAALRRAVREMDDKCTAAAGRLDLEAFDRLFEAEQAKVDLLHDQLKAAAEHDRWPRHLHWTL